MESTSSSARTRDGAYLVVTRLENAALDEHPVTEPAKGLARFEFQCGPSEPEVSQGERVSPPCVGTAGRIQRGSLPRSKHLGSIPLVE
jgi:hypothetical protein